MSNEDTQNAARVIRYNPQLDGLRFCAVFFVVSYHWLPSIMHIPISSFFGGVVNFFFVLSSYLITRILFSAKDKSVILQVSKFKVMLVFLLRRTVRIFPAYYFFLAILLLLPIIGSEVRSNAGMYFAYLANYHMYVSQDFPTAAAHIWTLAVEEQFYIFWPLVILFVPHRHLLKTLIAIIVGSVLLRAVTYHPAPVIPQVILTQYCVDAFAIGGLLAHLQTVPDKLRATVNRYFNIIMYAGIPLGILIIYNRSEYYSFVFNRMLFAMLSMRVIEGAITGYKSYFGKFLENKVVLYIGRISYGVYLYHLLVPILFWKLYDYVHDFIKLDHPGFYHEHLKAIEGVERFLILEWVGFIIYAILTIAAATLSWRLVEKPFTKLKVSYNPKAGKEHLNTANKPIT